MTARANAIRTSIDSISYSLADDLQAATGTLADALRNVPSVNVDPEGNVTLRGSSVTILVDGQPSGLFTGQSMAQAVLQIPANQYERIEVMTNPSAAYSPEGGGGVINLISKRNVPRPTQTTLGSVRANVGSNGGWNVGANGSWQKDRVTLSGDVSYRSEPGQLNQLRVREQFSPAGALVSTTTSDMEAKGEQDALMVRGSLQYKLTDRTRLTAEVRGTFIETGGPSRTLFETRDGSGTLLSRYTRNGDNGMSFDTWGATLRVLHQFDDDGHEWTNSLRYDSNSSDTAYTLQQAPVLPVGVPFWERSHYLRDHATIGFTSAYVRPLDDSGKLRLGYELTRQQPDLESRLLRGPTESGLVLVPAFRTDFGGTQTVHALYGTWERPFGEKFSAQAGLRLEQADIEVENRIGNISASQDYFRAYPTAHLQYKLSETQTLRGSYSRRIQRPQLSQLDPLISYQDPIVQTSGNPDLKPQETDSFEAMWQLRAGPAFFQVTGYFRDTDKAFSQVATDLGNGVILTRPENLGSSRSTGVELVASGALSPTLRYNVSFDLARQEIDAAGIPGGSDRSGTVGTGMGSLSWQVTPKDFVQVSGFWHSDSLLAQGTQSGGSMINVGYRRKLTDDLSLNVTGRDVFNLFDMSTHYETPGFTDRFENKLKLRAIFVGLTYTFGNTPRRPPEQFDFSAPTGG